MLAVFAAQETFAGQGQPAATTISSQSIRVDRYEVVGFGPFSKEVFAPILEKFTGTNMSLQDIAMAASALQIEYRKRGYENANISIATEKITNGVVTLNVFLAAKPQVFLSGKAYPVPSSIQFPATNAPTTKTNEEVHFVISGYEVTGNTLLTDDTLDSIMAKHVGTNATIGDIQEAMKELQLEYRARRYPTVQVLFPQQSLNRTNSIVKLQVLEGRLADITVTGNRHFSSNNVMAALPSLQTNMILNDTVFQAELDRANANQDRQIYPKIEEGPEPGTSALRLEVRDQFPLHGKMDFDNQSSPGTPNFRINTSAVYNNLWQLEHGIGAQYSFSPTDYKPGDQWKFYDQPLIANYSGFYRMPLGTPGSVSEAVATQPGTFGYDEATRRFTLPPSSGSPELTMFASRSTIDTGVLNLSAKVIQNNPGVLLITQQADQQDITVNNGFGFRLRAPVADLGGIHSSFSIGGDYKSYDLKSFKTNSFTTVFVPRDANGNPLPPTVSTVVSPVPETRRNVSYVPVSVGWDANARDGSNTTSFGFGYSANMFGLTPETQAKFVNVAGSSQADGYYHTVTANIMRDQYLFWNWRLGLRLDGQWANQPLISNEQYGIGGIAGVRGYREGEIYGDMGWRVTSELKTPVHTIGIIGKSTPLTVRGLIFMDYAAAYLIDPQGRKPKIPLWGTGVGFAANIGSTFETKFLFGIPLLNSPTTSADSLRIDFSFGAEF